jgi:hypothetical protein
MRSPRSEAEARQFPLENGTVVTFAGKQNHAMNGQRGTITAHELHGKYEDIPYYRVRAHRGGHSLLYKVGQVIKVW